MQHRGPAARVASRQPLQLFAGLMIPLFALFSVAAFCVFIAALVMLSTTGTLFGWSLLASIPLWVAIVLLCFVCAMIDSPLRHTRRALYIHRGGYRQEYFSAWDSIFSLGLLAVAGWFAYTHVPQVHDFFQHFPENVQIM